MPHGWALEKEESAKALELLDQALAIDPEYPPSPVACRLVLEGAVEISDTVEVVRLVTAAQTDEPRRGDVGILEIGVGDIRAQEIGAAELAAVEVGALALPFIAIAARGCFTS